MRRIAVGDVEVVSLLDGTERYPAARVYAEAGDALDGYARYQNDDGTVTLPFSSFLLRDGGLTVLVDTGNGPEVQGALIDDLREAGAKPADVDVVVFTHLHGDHTGWNIDRASGAAGFPNARYLVPRGDWDHYRAAQPPPTSFVRDIEALEGLGVMELIEGGYVISPALSTLHTPGHTPGHLSIAVSSGAASACVIGDAFLTPIDVAEPDWVTSFDWSAPEVRRTRRELMERLDGTDTIVAASHLPAPGLGRFAVTAEGRRFLPLP